MKWSWGGTLEGKCPGCKQPLRTAANAVVTFEQEGTSTSWHHYCLLDYLVERLNGIQPVSTLPLWPSVAVFLNNVPMNADDQVDAARYTLPWHSRHVPPYWRRPDAPSSKSKSVSSADELPPTDTSTGDATGKK